MASVLKRNGARPDSRWRPLLVLAAVAVLIAAGCSTAKPAATKTTATTAAITPATTPSATAKTTVSPRSTTSSTTTPAKSFANLDGKYLPGTSSSDWGSFAELGAPAPATSQMSASSNDLAYVASFFDFSTAAAAQSFYTNPPTQIHGFVGGALGYSPLEEPTGVAAPSRALDMLTCAGEGSGPTLDSSGQCSDGSAPYSLGAAVIFARSNVVGFVAYLSDANTATADTSAVANVMTLAGHAAALLASSGIS